jgi:hypothetical protein
LENLDTEVDIDRAGGTARENMKISANDILGYYELKKHKPRFNEGCSELLDPRKYKIAVVTESKRNKWE